MSKTLTVNSAVTLAQAHRELDAMWSDSRYLEIEIKRKAGQLTNQQRKSLHLFCEQLADSLNDAGYDMKRTLRQDVDIPWSKDTVKEYLWRPIQQVLTQKKSTNDIATTDPTLIHETLARHLGEKLGVTCPPWPKRERRAA